MHVDPADDRTCNDAYDVVMGTDLMTDVGDIIIPDSIPSIGGTKLMDGVAFPKVEVAPKTTVGDFIASLDNPELSVLIPLMTGCLGDFNLRMSALLPHVCGLLNGGCDSPDVLDAAAAVGLDPTMMNPCTGQRLRP